MVSEKTISSGTVFFENQPTLTTETSKHSRFAGSRLCKYIIDKAHTVIVRLEDGKVERYPRNRVKRITEYPEDDSDE